MSDPQPLDTKGVINYCNRTGYFDSDGKKYHSLHDLTSAGYDYFWSKPWRIKDKPVSVPKTFVLTMDRKL
jgi:hypothetical protein